MPDAPQPSAHADPLAAPAVVVRPTVSLPALTPPPAPTGYSAVTPAAVRAPVPPLHTCPLCAHAAPVRLRPDSRCTRCNAPLAPLPEPGRLEHELFGRRDAVRRDQSHVAMLHIGWPSTPLPVRWRDLSLTGLSFYAAGPVPEGARIHLVDQALEAVGEVVRCRPQGRVHVVHARLLAAVLLQATGVFVSAQA